MEKQQNLTPNQLIDYTMLDRLKHIHNKLSKVKVWTLVVKDRVRSLALTMENFVERQTHTCQDHGTAARQDTKPIPTSNPLTKRTKSKKTR